MDNWRTSSQNIIKSRQKRLNLQEFNAEHSFTSTPFLNFTGYTMRDLIWTIIIIWLAYRIVSAFRTIGARKQETLKKEKPETREKHDYEKALNKEGDYIDFEELD